MPKRKTIGKNPLSVAEEAAPAVAEIASPPKPVSASAMAAPVFKNAISNTVRRMVRIGGEAGAAVGGRLEILGGDLGFGGTMIWRFGRQQRMGFAAPSGRLVDLEGELQAIRAWPDRDEHRVLSAVGWAWALGSLGGIFGVLAGGGIRLLQPRRMVIELNLRDGRKLVARTDSVTATALEELSRGRTRGIVIDM